MKVYFTRNPSERNSQHIFVSNIVPCFEEMGIEWTVNVNDKWDVCLAVITVPDIKAYSKGPVVQRLDGVYIDKDGDPAKKNAGIISTYRKASGVIFQSEFCKKMVETNFGPSHCKSVIIHNGTDISKIDNPMEIIRTKYPEQAQFIERYSHKAITVASWRGIKRFDSVFNGMVEYLKRDKDACLIVIGGFPPEQQKLYLDRCPNVLFTGQISNEDVRQFQSISNVCLNLSIADACPNAVVEALAHGTPCVVTKNQGVVELIDSEGVVLDVDPWDYRPISYKKDIKQIDPLLVADAIEKCIAIGRHPKRKDLGNMEMAKKYAAFLKDFV